MRFNQEPPHSHGVLSSTAVVLVNLGTPDAPTASAVRPYLKQFLSDPRVVEISRVVWWLILNCIILPFRPAKSARKYASIWTDEGSPLRVHTEKQAMLLQGYLGQRGHHVLVVHAMRYGNPSLPDVLRKLKEHGCDRILILPAYPQYSGTTTASTFDAVFHHYGKIRNLPELRLVKHYHDHHAYIQALKSSVLAHWEKNGRADQLVMSFHGVPKRTLLLGDPYYCECHKTARLLATQLGLTAKQYTVSFQSRLGKAEWLQPYTAPLLCDLAKNGVLSVEVICPGFTSDCLETLEEIEIEAKRDYLAAGGKTFHYIPCLNESPDWINALTEITEQHMMGWPTLVTARMGERLQSDALTGRNRAKQLGAKE
jgi:ferrochelatase